MPEPVKILLPWRLAAGRRHFNAMRQFHADLRRAKLLALLDDDAVSSQRALAARLKVHEATISRDLRRLQLAGIFRTRARLGRKWPREGNEP